jgi:hypothetical protein
MTWGGLLRAPEGRVTSRGMSGYGVKIGKWLRGREMKFLVVGGLKKVASAGSGDRSDGSRVAGRHR